MKLNPLTTAFDRYSFMASAKLYPSRRWQLCLALLAGLLTGLAPAPFNAWLLPWVTIAPLWAMVVHNAKLQAQHQERQSPWLIFNFEGLIGLCWGIGYHGLALSWITGLHPLTWMGVPWLGSIAITLFCWVFITLWGALLSGSWAGLMRRLITVNHARGAVRSASLLPTCQRLLLGIALWCGLEQLWGYGALYWTSISYTQSPYNPAILHLGQVSGALTISAALMAVNGLLAEAWLQRQAVLKARNLAILALSLLVSLHLAGFGLYLRPVDRPAQAALKIGIVQGNIPTRIKLYENGLRQALNAYTRGYEALADQGVDAVLTPEGALPWLWVNTSYQDNNPLYRAIRQRRVMAWVGSVGTQADKITQSLFTITGTGEIFSRYDKVKLVPLGEYIPFASVLGGLIGRLSPVEATMMPGSFHQHVDTPLGRAIVGICYESAFSLLFRDQAAAGGEFILTASNNDPYSAAMMAQHHAQDVMRAIETDRWAARATNTGYSAFVDPHGKTLWMSNVRTYEVHAETIYRRQTQTPYVRWGNWLTPLLLGSAGLLWGAAQLKTRWGDR